METEIESGAVDSVVCEVASTATAPPFASSVPPVMRAVVTEVFSFTASADEKVSDTAT